MKRSRRQFLADATAAASGLAFVPLTVNADTPAPDKLPMRPFCRNKSRISCIGFGLAPLGSDNSSRDDVQRIITTALDLGINYFDASPTYGDIHSRYGSIEMKLNPILAKRRKDIVLATKIEPDRQDRDGVLRQVDEALKRLGVDYIDVIHIHNLGDFDMERVLGANGALAGLKEARRRGLIRFIGTSGHQRPARFQRAFDTGEIDVTMNPYNFADKNTYNFEGVVLPAAKKAGVSVLAMKVLGGCIDWRYDAHTPANFAVYHERAIRYSMGLPGVACAVIGFSNEDEVRKAVRVARAYRPLDDAERSELLAKGIEIARQRGLYFGPING